MTAFENHSNYNCQIITDDGAEYLVFANWLSNNNLHRWQGWHCEAGATRIYIDKELEVWSGECHNDRLGDMVTGWQLIDDHSVCRRESCTGCTDDLITAKRKP